MSIRAAAAPDVEIYYTKAVHESLDENALEALPYLVEAALEGYPQGSNQTRRVEIPRQRLSSLPNSFLSSDYSGKPLLITVCSIIRGGFVV